MIEIQIINILSLFWKHNTFLAVYCTLLTVIQVEKQNKTVKQISKQNKTKKKKKGRMEKEAREQNLNPGPLS